jgi:hypothetical protein
MKGFTLIETIIYLALFSIVIGGALAATILLFESAGHDTTGARLQGEGAFILSKIAYNSTQASISDTYLQTLTDPSVVVSNAGFYTASSSDLGTPIYSTGVYFTLTTHTRQGRSQTVDFFATSTI